MWKYPIKSDKIGYVSLKEACQWCNEAFLDGFMSAHYETADEWERMTVEERIGYCCMAVERCAILRREAPPELNFSGGRVIALILYRPLQRVVTGERGLYKCIA